MRYRNPGKSYTVRWPGDPDEGLAPISWTAEVHEVGGQPRVDLFRNGQIYAEGISWGEVRDAMAMRDGKRGRQLAARFLKVKAKVVKNPAKKRRKASKSKKRAPRSRAYQIQSLLLDRETFTEASARAWLKKNRHSADSLSFSEDFIHAVQHPRGDYRKGSLHNIQIAKHVEATVGLPLSDSPAAEAPGYNKRGPRQQRLKLAPRRELVMGMNADEPYYTPPDLPF